MKEQHLQFESRPENLVLAEKLVDEVCETYKVGEEHYGNILIAVTEAVNNAIHHGNKADHNKKVAILFKVTDNHQLIFKIQDEGNGFDYNNLPDPTSPDNLEKPDGRGIFIIKQLADKVNFNNKGAEVELIFNTNTSV